MSRKQFNKRRTISIECRKKAAALTWAGSNFLSGTVSPAKSNPATQNIEDPSHAFTHFADRGVGQVIVQVKDMGSRASAHIFRNLEDSYFTSRGGFRVKRKDRMDEINAALKEEWEKWFGENGRAEEDLEFVLVDGELMPWELLGKDMIEREFNDYHTVGSNELSDLKDLGFFEACDKTVAEFMEDERRASDVKTILAHTDYEELADCWAKFLIQVEIYGAVSDPKFNPFNILKKTYKDGREEILHAFNLENYMVVGEHPFAVIDPSLTHEERMADPDFAAVMAYIESNQLEGFVVKPVEFYINGEKRKRFAPYIKVRNHEYLRIIYGFDYTVADKLQKLIARKAIGRKVNASIEQFIVGDKMLRIPVSVITERNKGRPSEEYFKLALSAIDKFEQTDLDLDPRL